jgi:hypothetical protein
LAAITTALVVVGGITAALAGATATPKVKVVATGLNSPKHLLYTAKGVYVVESGTGGRPGAHNCATGPKVTGAGTTSYCAGSTGAVALISGRHVTVAAGKLASVVEQDSGEISGPSGVTLDAGGALSVLYQDGLVKPDGSNGLKAPAHKRFGTLQISRTVSANIARFDALHPQGVKTLGGTPGETAYDSDPYDVITYKSGYVVADAAANSLLSVSRSGKIRLLARFPTRTEQVPAGVFGPSAVPVDAQAVPTSVAVGPDGALYVGTLRGVPSLPGTADVYRVVPGHAPTVWASGLTSVTAIAFDAKRRLLATELSNGGLLAPPTVPGSLVRISANGKKRTTLPVSGLFDPTGVAVSASGAVYVANRGTSSGKSKTPGQVLKITGLG